MLNNTTTMAEPVWPLIPSALSALESNGIGDLAALNRWPERGALPLGTYLQRWEASCLEINIQGELPRYFAALLDAHGASARRTRDSLRTMPSLWGTRAPYL